MLTAFIRLSCLDEVPVLPPIFEDDAAARVGWLLDATKPTGVGVTVGETVTPAVQLEPVMPVGTQAASDRKSILSTPTPGSYPVMVMAWLPADKEALILLVVVVP